MRRFSGWRWALVALLSLALNAGLAGAAFARPGPFAPMGHGQDPEIAPASSDWLQVVVALGVVVAVALILGGWAHLRQRTLRRGMAAPAATVTR